MDRSVSPSQARDQQWLKQYYFVRAVFSIIWVALAFSVGRRSDSIAAVLLMIYPAWDALANGIDMARSGGGFARNRTQAINVAISAVTTVAVIVALQSGMNVVLGVFGAWAIVSGLLQLGTALRRWKSFGGQWSMVLSGAQSALAGGAFLAMAHAALPMTIVRVGGYAGVGALYFLISALWILVSEMRRRGLRAS